MAFKKFDINSTSNRNRKAPGILVAIYFDESRRQFWNFWWVLPL